MEQKSGVLSDHERGLIAAAIDKGMAVGDSPAEKRSVPGGPMGSFESQRLSHQAAALGRLFERYEHTRPASELLLEIGSESPISKVQWGAIGDVAAEVLADLEAQRMSLFERTCKHVQKGAITGQQFIRGLGRIGMLGDPAISLDDLPIGELPAPAQSAIRTRWAVVTGYQSIVEGHRFDDIEPQASGSGHDNPDYQLAARIRELFMADEALAAQRLVLGELQAVERDANVCSVARRILLHGAKEMPQQWDGSETRWQLRPALNHHLHWSVNPPTTELIPLCALLSRCIYEGSIQRGATPVLKRIFAHIPHEGANSDPNKGYIAELSEVAGAAWLTRGETAKQLHTCAVGRAAGYRVDEEPSQAGFLRDGSGDRPSSIALPQIRITDRAANIFAGQDSDDEGLLVLGIHQMWEPAFKGWAGAWEASGQGRESLCIADIQTPDFLAENLIIENAAKESGRPLSLMVRKDQTKTVTIERTLEALGSGSAVFSAIDVTVEGAHVSVPWFLLPSVLPSFPLAAALRSKAKVAVEAYWTEPDGTVSVDMLLVEPPPESGDFATRTRWFTQRVAQAFRELFAEGLAPLEFSGLAGYGGLPRELGLVPVAEWASTPEAKESVVGWLGETNHAERTAMVFDERSLSFSQLRSLALRFAALMLHYQGQQWPAKPTESRFLDQHRVLIVSPPGEIVPAAILGAIASGSMVSFAQTDLSPEAIKARAEVYDPHLILSTASAFAALAQQLPDVLHKPYLIFDDRADTAAAFDLLQSFDEADALPPLDLARPALVTFTSGSSGEPKGAVIPTSIHSGGAGIDKLGGIGLGSVLVLLGRWDGISVPDMFAALRASATVVVPSDETMRSPSALVEWMQSKAVTMLYAPPTLWYLLSKCSAWPAYIATDTLRSGMMWGEPIAQKALAAFEDSAPNVTVFCTFGATELSYVTFGEVTSSELADYKGSPGGKLVDGVSMELLEGGGALVSGADAMLGYFVDLAGSNPILSEQAEFEVRLSDQLLLRPNGSIDVLGRDDSIIKIGGKRVALTAIQDVAEGFPEVERAVAMAVHDGQRHAVQLAVQASSLDSQGLEGAISDAVEEQLMPAARPSLVKLFEALPIAPSGKVDRRALAEAMNSSSDPKVEPSKGQGPDLSQYSDDPILSVMNRWHVDRHGSPLKPDEVLAITESLSMLELLVSIEEVVGRPVEVCEVLRCDGSSWRDVANHLRT